MAPNLHLPHVLVLPEDRADSQLANGFLLTLPLFSRRMQVLVEAGGWTRAIDQFEADHIVGLERWPNRFLVLLLDFDNHEGRLTHVKSRIPEHLQDRVFVLGSLTNPEDLRRSFGTSLEDIGKALAKDCQEDSYESWGHDLLRHNAAEIDRLRNFVRPILFPTN